MLTKLTLLRKFINFTAYVAPFISARLSYKIWTSTYRHKMPDRELPAFNAAEKQKIIVDDAMIMTYTWQVSQSRPTILLLHGWNGRGTQMCSFVTMLTEVGYGVVAFDARGHGLSEGNHTNILESVAVVKKLSGIYGDFFAMIGHSFGAMAAVNSIKAGVVCEKLICISPPTEFSELLRFFTEQLVLNQKSSDVLENFVLAKYNIHSFEQISITGIAPEMCVPCLMIHDRNDESVPLSQAQKAVALWGRGSGQKQRENTGENVSLGENASGAKLHVTEGLGHVRILRKPPALKAAMDFLHN